MNILEQFLNGGWRLCRWDDYYLREKARVDKPDKSIGLRRPGIIRRLIVAFFSAIIADLVLSFIVWLLIMMGISELNLESRFGAQIDPLNLLIWIWVILFVLFFLGFFGLIKTK
jgi:uncharacterized BrkB/YihY/UPF0761 family membrane protein